MYKKLVATRVSIVFKSAVTTPKIELNTLPPHVHTKYGNRDLVSSIPEL